MVNSIYHSNIIFNIFMKLNLCEIYSNTVLKHIISIVISSFMFGYKGKTINFEANSNNHRTTIAHFLNNGKWNSQKLENCLKNSVLSVIYNEAEKVLNLSIVSLMILSHLKQSPRQRLCIQ